MRTLSILTISLLFISCQPKDLPTYQEIKKDYVLVKFSHMTTKSELEQIQNDVKKASDIDFNYGNSVFFEDGKLRELKFSIRTPQNASGSASADLMALQFKYYGFLYNPGGSPSLKTGVFE